MKIYRESDVSDQPLEGKTVAIVGYGSQGRAHALNLRDSGIDVRVACRPNGPSDAKAREDGFTPQGFEEAVAGADLVALLIPDTAQPDLYGNTIEPSLRKGATLLFAHGFNIHYGTVEPREDLDVVMVAPKSPGDLVRRQYEMDRGVPCLMAIARDGSGEARAIALGYAHALGGTRAGVLETTFEEETETDLFGEQAVICGGVTALLKAGFETLTEAGYQPAVAYFECLHELKLIVDLLYEGGLARMHECISDTASYGDLTRGSRIIDKTARARMREVLAEIKSGEFARDWIKEATTGADRYSSLRRSDLDHPIEAVGSELRADMSWLRTPGEGKR